MALMRLMGPAEGVSVICPRCWQPIAGIHMPRWAWLVRFARYQPAACPCHHVLSGPNLSNLTEQVKANAEQMEKEA